MHAYTRTYILEGVVVAAELCASESALDDGQVEAYNIVCGVSVQGLVYMVSMFISTCIW